MQAGAQAIKGVLLMCAVFAIVSFGLGVCVVADVVPSFVAGFVGLNANNGGRILVTSVIAGTFSAAFFWKIYTDVPSTSASTPWVRAAPRHRSNG